MDFKKYYSSATFTTLYVIGCIWGLVQDFRYLVSHNEDFWSHIINGILTPFIYGFCACLLYAVVAFVVSFIVENYMKEKTFAIVATTICLLVAIFFTFTIKG